jgi:hypothetical protein
MSASIALSPQGLLRHRALGTEAVYRVIDVADRMVSVEVVEAPGLEQGTRFQITRSAANAMQQIRGDAVAELSSSYSPFCAYDLRHRLAR